MQPLHTPTNKRTLIMAKVQGPLFSMDATGTYGGAITFGKWKGRNVARTRVAPATPRSSGQETSRNRMRLAAALQVWINGNTEIDSGETVTPLVYLKANAPSGQAWNCLLYTSDAADE